MPVVEGTPVGADVDPSDLVPRVFGERAGDCEFAEVPKKLHPGVNGELRTEDDIVAQSHRDPDFWKTGDTLAEGLARRWRWLKNAPVGRSDQL